MRSFSVRPALPRCRATRATELRKEKEVPNYNRDLYQSVRTFAMAGDGTKIPISLVFRKNCKCVCLAAVGSAPAARSVRARPPLRVRVAVKGAYGSEWCRGSWAKDRKPSPMMLYGYGSYGICTSALPGALRIFGARCCVHDLTKASAPSKCIELTAISSIFSLYNMSSCGYQVWIHPLTRTASAFWTEE